MICSNDFWKHFSEKGGPEDKAYFDEHVIILDRTNNTEPLYKMDQNKDVGGAVPFC